MPNLDNAKKALRQNKVREAQNRVYKNKIKTLTRKINDFVKAGSLDEAKKLVPNFYKAVDKATKKNILKKNTASRRKSLIARTVSSNKRATATKPEEAHANTAEENSSQAK